MEFWADSESSSGEADYSTDEELSEAVSGHEGKQQQKPAFTVAGSYS